MRNYRTIAFSLIFSVGFITNAYASEISNQPSELTYQQRELLSRAKADIDAENKLTKACQLVGDDKLDQAMAELRKIEWWKTSIKVNAKGIDDESNKQMISYFQRFERHDAESCRVYSRAFILDSIAPPVPTEQSNVPIVQSNGLTAEQNALLEQMRKKAADEDASTTR